MELGLHGHTALVTGSSGGIGACIVEMLAAEGCTVLVHGRSRDRAQQVLDRIRAAGGNAALVIGDLTVRDQLDGVVAAGIANRVDILVNNAGPFVEHTWNDVSDHDWLSAFTSNVVSTAHLTQALTPTMAEAGWGRVVNIASRSATTPLPNMVEYSAAKAAVANMTVSLAQHLSGTGVTVNWVSPGVILTPSLQQMFLDRHHPAESWETIEPTVTAEYAPNPSGRLGRPEDIAAAITYLCSEHAGYINGANLRVDGGITATL